MGRKSNGSATPSRAVATTENVVPKTPAKSPKTRAQKALAAGLTPKTPAVPKTPVRAQKTPARAQKTPSAKTPSAKTPSAKTQAAKAKTPAKKVVHATIPSSDEEEEEEEQEIRVVKSVPPSVETVAAKKEEEVDSDEGEESGDEEKEEGEKSEKVKNEVSGEVTQSMKRAVEKAGEAIAALQKHQSESASKSLFPDVDLRLRLTVAYKKPAVTTDRGQITVVLPHTNRTINNTSVCIIMPDLDQSDKAKVDFDVEKQSREWAEKIEVDHGLTSAHYARILTKREVERIAHTYADRRKLATMYDIFLADGRCFKSVRAHLGKEFHKVGKTPLVFKYQKPLSTTIKNALNSTTYSLRRYLPRVSAWFGTLDQSRSDLLDNINCLVSRIAEKCPGGFANIRNIYLGTKDNSLPIYTDEGSATEIHLPTSSKRDHVPHKEISDDCSTLPDGLKIAVRNNSRIRVLKEETNEAVLFPTVNDEHSVRDRLKPTIDPKKVLKKREHRRKGKEIVKKQIKKRLIKKAKKAKKGPVNTIVTLKRAAISSTPSGSAVKKAKTA